MTTVTAEQRLTIVKHLAAGKDLDWVAAATRFDRSVVLDIASRHGYPDVSKLAWARDVLAELGDMLAAERAKVEARRKRLRAAAEKIRETTGACDLDAYNDGWWAPAELAMHALWSPRVALAVADLLDEHAEEEDDLGCPWRDCRGVALADLILGAES